MAGITFGVHTFIVIDALWVVKCSSRSANSPEIFPCFCICIGNRFCIGPVIGDIIISVHRFHVFHRFVKLHITIIADNEFAYTAVLGSYNHNAIGTTWLRASLLPEAQRGPVKDLLRRYVDVRVKAQAVANDPVQFAGELRRSAEAPPRR